MVSRWKLCARLKVCSYVLLKKNLKTHCITVLNWFWIWKLFVLYRYLKTNTKCSNCVFLKTVWSKIVLGYLHKHVFIADLFLFFWTDQLNWAVWLTLMSLFRIWVGCNEPFPNGGPDSVSIFHWPIINYTSNYKVV